MPDAAIDHLVVVAGALEDGVRYVHAALGVKPAGGGRHARMGTHNRLLRLGAALYLEVIAPDPAAPRPAQARWFGLDAPPARPRLATWVASVSDIDASAAACGERLGTVEPMTRGPYSWRITIPGDGAPPFDGMLPALIQWDGDAHPASALPDSGCSLVALEARHTDAARIRRALDAIGFDGPFSVCPPAAGERPGLAAVIDTPLGRRRL